MALQPYADPGQALALYQANQVSEEEQKRREQEASLFAEELDKKLRYIVDDVPDRTYRVMGSNAGAGSGEFHIYRHSKRREQERLQRIDEEAERQQKEKERQERLAQLEQADEEKTAKRRAKRQKKKEKQRSKKQKQEGGAVEVGAPPVTAEDWQADSGGSEDEDPAVAQPDLD